MIISPAGKVAAYLAIRATMSASSREARRSTPTSSSAPHDEMHVSVVEARHDQTAAGIDDLRVRPGEIPHVLVRSDRDDDLAGHGERLRARAVGIDRMDVRVDDDEVGGHTATSSTTSWVILMRIIVMSSC